MKAACSLNSCDFGVVSGGLYCWNHLCRWKNTDGKLCDNCAPKGQWCDAHTCSHPGCNYGSEDGKKYCYNHLCIYCGEYSPTYKACIKHKCIISGCAKPMRIDYGYATKQCASRRCESHSCAYRRDWHEPICDNLCDDGVCNIHKCSHLSVEGIRCAIIVRPGYILHCRYHMCLWSLSDKDPICGKYAPAGHMRCAEHTA